MATAPTEKEVVAAAPAVAAKEVEKVDAPPGAMVTIGATTREATMAQKAAGEGSKGYHLAQQAGRTAEGVNHVKKKAVG